MNQQSPVGVAMWEQRGNVCESSQKLRSVRTLTVPVPLLGALGVGPLASITSCRCCNTQGVRGRCLLMASLAESGPFGS